MVSTRTSRSECRSTALHSIARSLPLDESRCHVVMLIERSGVAVWVGEREVVLCDGDLEAMERTAKEAAAAIAEHLARWRVADRDPAHLCKCDVCARFIDHDDLEAFAMSPGGRTPIDSGSAVHI